MDTAIHIENLVKVYKDFWGRQSVRAVNNVSLSVRRGEIFGLVGLNGSGKTTTMKILLGLLYPTSGTVSVLGKPPTDTRKNARIGFLPEESFFYRFLNGMETLDFFGALYGMPRRERRHRAEELIERVGLSHAKKRRLKSYSKGMLRRIGIAQALLNRPELIVLDEPTSGLDPLGRDMALEMITEARDWGATVVLCTHLFEQVGGLLDSVGVLHKGRLCGRADFSDGQVQHEDGRMELADYFRQRIGPV